MGLFGSARVKETTLADCRRLIEDFLRKEGLNPEEQRVEGYEHGWWAMRGSALVYVFVNEHEVGSSIRIVSPILILPEENLLPFYRACLEINSELVSCAVAIDKDVVMLVHERPLKGLDAEEISDNMHMIAQFADKFDNELAEEFGATIYSERMQ